MEEPVRVDAPILELAAVSLMPDYVVAAVTEPGPATRWLLEQDFGGAFDGVTVTSDADPGL